MVDILRKAFSSSHVLVPQRHHHDFPNPKEGKDSTMLLMPAWNPGEDGGVKIVTISPNNAKYDLPTIQGLYIYLDAQKGTPLALLDAKALTNKRTAAASALASSFLSRKDASVLLMIGTGALCRDLVQAHSAVRPIDKVLLYGRNYEKATAIAEELTQEGYATEPVANIKEAIHAVDIISCATLSKEPLVQGSWLHEGQHLDMVGAYRVDMREADDDVLLKSVLFVDNFNGALKETGDLVIPLKNGVIKPKDVQADFFDLCKGKHTGRQTAQEITFFKSVGFALEDLVGARYYFEQWP